ncbi:hypothetical protein BDB01DRAFT_888721 [Pilobolus umbonatus]|nr:hypothetical protein BDB01DRAFT_888721 [Pilobolus umbonatus]
MSTSSAIIQSYSPIPPTMTVPTVALKSVIDAVVAKHGVRWVITITRKAKEAEASVRAEDGQPLRKKKTVDYEFVNCQLPVQKKSKKIGCPATLKVTCFKNDPDNVVIKHNGENNHAVGSPDNLRPLPLSFPVKGMIEQHLGEGYVNCNTSQRQVTVLKEKFEGDKSGSNASSNSSISFNLELVNIYINGCSALVGTIIKREALDLRQRYHSLDVHGKAIISLGSNSVSDLSFSNPDPQTKCFERLQWKQLRTRYPPKKYNIDAYTHLLEPLSSIRGTYDRKKSFDTKWLNLYMEFKRLNSNYDPNIQAEHCIHLLLQIMSIIKNQPHLFDDEIDSSEWFVVMFWVDHRTFILWDEPALKVG